MDSIDMFKCKIECNLNINKIRNTRFMNITVTFILSLVEHSNSNLVAYFIDLINHIYPYINVCIETKFNVLDVIAY